MNTKSTIKFVAILVAISLAYLLGGHNADIARKNASERLEIAHMASKCNESYNVIDGGLEEQCEQLIDSVQSKGYEVISKDGNFWAESNWAWYRIRLAKLLTFKHS